MNGPRSYSRWSTGVGTSTHIDKDRRERAAEAAPAGEVDWKAADRAMAFAASCLPNGTLSVGSNEGLAYLALRAQLAELRSVLADLVKVNEEWNAAVESTIGRPPNWTDGYLDRARAILDRHDAERKAGV